MNNSKHVVRPTIVDECVYKYDKQYDAYHKLRKFWLKNRVESEAKLPTFLLTFACFLGEIQRKKEQGRVHVDNCHSNSDRFSRELSTLELRTFLEKRDKRKSEINRRRAEAALARAGITGKR